MTHYAGLLPAPLASLALLSVGLLTQPAVADESGPYLGASTGYTLTSYRRSDLDNAVIGNVAGGGYTLALSGSSDRYGQPPWSLDLGYQFSSYFGLEASYLDLGTLKYASAGTETSIVGGGSFAVDLSIRSRGPALAVVGTLPLTNDWRVETRLGAYEGKTTTEFVSTFNGTPNSGSDSKASTTLLASLGASYVLAAHWVLHVEYTHLNHLGEKVLSQSFNVDMVTAGVDYAF